MKNAITQWIDAKTAIDKPDINVVVAALTGLEKQKDQLDKGMEEHPMNAEAEYIKGWSQRLKDDESHYVFMLDYLLVPGKLQQDRQLFVDKFHDAKFILTFIKIVAKHMKDELPDREEINTIAQLLHTLEKNDLVNDDLVEFLNNIRHKIFEHLLELRKKHKGSKALKELLSEIHKSREIEHVQKYVALVKYLETHLYGLMHDDAQWTHFRKLYSERELVAKAIADQYGDPDHARVLLHHFEKNREDRNGTIRLLNDMIQKLKSPQSLKEAQKKGIDQLRNIIGHTLRFYKSRLESLRRELLAACETRVRELERSKTTVVKDSTKLIKVLKKDLHNIAGISFAAGKDADAAALADVNRLLGEPGKLEHGLKRLRAFARDGKVGYARYADLLIRLKERREDFIEKAKLARRQIYSGKPDKIIEARTMAKTVYGAQADKWSKLELSSMLATAIVHYDKELLLILAEIPQVKRNSDKLHRYQAIFIRDVFKKVNKALGPQAKTAQPEMRLN